MSNVIISVASEFDAKGFKQADKGIQALTKTTAKFIGTLALAHKAQKAMFAYMADEKATKVLAQNLKNLGLAYSIKPAEEFIASMQEQTGILDDELRPAYAQLARVTGSTLETQRLLKLAFDVSAGSGKDYATVVDALSQAYVGNYKGLKTLNIGLTQAELKTKSFSEISDILNSQFAGAGSASLDSYSGQMALLTVASSNAAEAIGKSLLDAIVTVSGQGGMGSFVNQIKGAVQWLTDLITGVSRTVALLGVVASSRTIGGKITEIRRLNAKWDAEDLQVQKERLGIANNYASYQEKIAAEALAQSKWNSISKKLEADRLALLKKQTNEAKAKAAIDKANKTLSSAKGIFDLEGIQIAAALQGNITAEQRQRLELMKMIYDLEQAIDQGNTSLIEKLTAQLEALTKQTIALNANLVALTQIQNVLANIGYDRTLFDINNLTQTLGLLNSITGSSYTPKSFVAETPLDLYKPLLIDFANAAAEQVVVSEVNITIDGSIQDLINVTVDGLQQQDASGISTRIIRNTGGLSW